MLRKELVGGRRGEVGGLQQKPEKPWRSHPHKDKEEEEVVCV